MKGTGNILQSNISGDTSFIQQNHRLHIHRFPKLGTSSPIVEYENLESYDYIKGLNKSYTLYTDIFSIE